MARSPPRLAPELLKDALGVAMSAFTEARIEDAEISQVVPTQYRADLVVLLLDGVPVRGIIVEVQLSPSDEKRFSWPFYAAALRARLRCPCCLMVVTPDERLAKWATEPIELGQPGSAFRPLVLGPRSAVGAAPPSLG